MSDEKTLEDLFDKFNKEFFNDELPKIPIKIDSGKTKKVAGCFKYYQEMTLGGKHIKFKDLKKKDHDKFDSIESSAWEKFVSSSFIEFPKDAAKKGFYYYASVLLHEMTHEYIAFCTKVVNKDPHGKEFRKKIDEINKKSKNEYRVPYEEVPQILMSDKPLKDRPEGIDEINENIFKKVHFLHLNN